MNGIYFGLFIYCGARRTGMVEQQLIKLRSYLGAGQLRRFTLSFVRNTHNVPGVIVVAECHKISIYENRQSNSGDG